VENLGGKSLKTAKR